MATKVLVFESDPAFAGELRSELAKLGCTVTVVEDGNLGLQQAAADRPDLILLSIELPRMNGFSVCNKLKKDPNLKDVPLIIMSSESSDETFEQHKKLRTRAEDYVHKPVAFRDLLARIQAFVSLAPSPHDSEGAIVIEDEIEIGSTEYLADDFGEAPTQVPASAPHRVESVDADVDAFAESAFGRLTETDAPPSHASEARLARNGASSADSAAAAAHVVSTTAGSLASAVATRGSTLAPPPIVPLGAPSVDPAEHERVKGELARASLRLEDLGRALDELQGELESVRAGAGEAERKAREVDELRAKLAAMPKPGGGREFLDLREALNKKDKEILALKELISKKDRQLVEAQDHALATERAHSDLDERLLARERELEEIRERSESLAADRDLAKKAAEDFRARLDKARAESETKDQRSAELRARHAEELAAAEARVASVRAEVDQVLANERAEHARVVDQVEARRRNEVAQARREGDALLAEVRREAEARLADARSEAEESLARARADAEGRTQAALEQLRQEIEGKAALELGEERERSAKLASELASSREEATFLQRIREELEAKLGAEAARAAAVENDFAAARRDVVALEEKLAAATDRADRSEAKWRADRQSLDRAKDALAVALAQIEEAEGRPA